MRMKTGRVCVTLPLETLDDFKEKSRMTGLSISRLIYRRLRSGKPIVIVADNILAKLDEVHEMLERLEKNEMVDVKILEAIRSYINHADRIVEYGTPTETVHIRIHPKKLRKNTRMEGK